VIDRLEQCLLAVLPRLIHDEVHRALRQQGSLVSRQITSRLDLPVNNTSPVMSRGGTASAPVTALQLLHAGHVNSAFETVIDLVVFLDSIACIA